MTETKPTADLSLQWMPGSKFSMNASMSYYMRNIQPSEINPVVTQISDLEWLKGNPDLKSGDLWYFSMSGNYLLTNIFTTSWYLGYILDRNVITKLYTPNTQEIGGVLSTYNNIPTYGQLTFVPDFNLRLFNNRLNVTLSPQYQYFYCSPQPSEKRTLSALSGSIGLSTTVKGVGMSLRYSLRYKDLSNSGLEKRRRPDNLSFSLYYGTGDFFVSLGVNNILHKRYKEYSYYTTPIYSSSKHIERAGRSLSLNLSYFFGYGKEVDSSIDIESVSAGPSSVL